MKKLSLLLALLTLWPVLASAASPLQDYDAYTSAIKNAHKLDELYGYWTKSRTTEVQTELKAIKKQGGDPEDVKALMLEQFKDRESQLQIKSRDSKLDGKQAILVIDAIERTSKQPLKILLELRNEGGSWKVHEETYDLEGH